MTFEIDHLFNHQQHLPQVAAWQQAAFGYLNPGGTAEQRAERLRGARDGARLPLALVAIGAGDLLGSASVVATTLTHQHLAPWLSAVFVPPEHRGRGIASQLALRAVAEAGRLGFETLHLFTPNREALYARLGWTTFGHAAINGVDVCLMARPTA